MRDVPKSCLKSPRSPASRVPEQPHAMIMGSLVSTQGPGQLLVSEVTFQAGGRLM